MRRFAMSGTPMVLPVLVWTALLGGCGTVSGLFGPADSRLSPSTAPVTMPSGLSGPAAVKPEPPPAPSAPPAGRLPLVSERSNPALPGAARLASTMAASPERFYRDAVLTEDTVWRGEVFVEGGITVAPQTTLTVEPGTVVRFRRTVAGEGAGPLLLVQGRLVARGSAEAPVRFTSSFSDPRAGEWQGIVFLGSEKKNLLEQCRVEGAAVGIDASFSTVTLKEVSLADCGTGARFQDSIVTVSGGSASGCAVGMDFADSESDIRGITVRGNGRGMTVRGGSLFLEGAGIADNREAGLIAAASRLTIDRSIFQGSAAGLLLTDCEGTVTGARIADNREIGIQLIRSRVKVHGNEIVSNGDIGLRVEDGRGLAWGNVFSGNGRFDIDNTGAEDFRAMANWWGEPAPVLEKRLNHRIQDPSRGRILVQPLLTVRPPLATLNSVAK
uniref:DUF1565 domain-containing protein n=1 Tax=Geobacter metallireducens TaxID=28232 RepID=A0A831U1X0_GEOME